MRCSSVFTLPFVREASRTPTASSTAFPRGGLHNGPGTPPAGQAGSHCPPPPPPEPEDHVPNLPAPCVFMTPLPSAKPSDGAAGVTPQGPPRQEFRGPVPRAGLRPTLKRPPRGQNQLPSPSVRCLTWGAWWGQLPMKVLQDLSLHSGLSSPFPCPRLGPPSSLGHIAGPGSHHLWDGRSLPLLPAPRLPAGWRASAPGAELRAWTESTAGRDPAGPTVGLSHSPIRVASWCWDQALLTAAGTQPPTRDGTDRNNANTQDGRVLGKGGQSKARQCGRGVPFHRGGLGGPCNKKAGTP